jgi:prevent-host-death family protein
MPAVVNIHEAKTHFSKLVERARNGERITIAKAGVPVAMLVAIEPETRPRRIPGMDKGRVIIHDNFDDPLPEFDPDYMHPGDPMRNDAE